MCQDDSLCFKTCVHGHVRDTWLHAFSSFFPDSSLLHPQSSGENFVSEHNHRRRLEDGIVFFPWMDLLYNRSRCNICRWYLYPFQMQSACRAFGSRSCRFCPLQKTGLSQMGDQWLAPTTKFKSDVFNGPMVLHKGVQCCFFTLQDVISGPPIPLCEQKKDWAFVTRTRLMTTQL